ncbi:lipopolysaccharide biosynthesis protein [Fulvivirga sediminis]|uniref:Uncharacterized protein n=1 Tax=Fulvivirga sediminis TaxID=2803949 RepID=A0A937F5K2_9BACT|nr:hypothetical protein [Fulvivirga sediminis]MBL3656781.1 hypothetical protein [Fulvivirga sediminis]
MSLINKILNNDKLIVVTNQVAVSGTTFLTNIIMVALCGVSVFGEFSAWQIALLLILAFQIATLSQPMQVFLGKKEGEEVNHYSASVQYLQLIFIVLLAIGFVAFNTLTGMFEREVSYAFTFFASMQLSQEHLRRYLIAKGKLRTALVSDLISSLGQLLLLSLFWIKNISPSLIELFLTIGGTTLPALIFSLLSERKVFLYRPELIKYVKEHWISARWLVPTALIQWGASNYLLAASAVIAGNAVLGVLRLAQTTMGVFNVAIQGLENYFLPYLSRLISKNIDDALQFTFRMIRKIGLLTAPILILAAIFSSQILSFINHDYVAYSSLLRWCCLLYIIILSSFPVKLFIRVLGDSRHYFIGYAISMTASVICAQWFIEQWNAVGVVMGWLLSQILINLYWTIIITKTKQLSWTLK